MYKINIRLTKGVINGHKIKLWKEDAILKHTIQKSLLHDSKRDYKNYRKRRGGVE